MRNKQSGVMLLEALIAILIFSLGILGVVGMQASAVKANRDAKYRADAGLLANELVGQMMSGDRTGTTLQTNFQGDDDDLLGTSLLADGPLFLQWRARVRAALPGADLNDPRVTVTPGLPGPPQTSSVVTIVVRWLPPNETVPHSYFVAVNII
jgi:type IV pilus assembly protein PilV